MKILHPVDGSAASLRATEYVLRLNQSCRPVRCTAIYVQAPILYIVSVQQRASVDGGATEGRSSASAATDG